MNFDRNTVIGFIVLALLFGGYFWWTSKEQSAYRAQKARQDSIAKANAPKIDTAISKIENAKNDSIAKVKTAGGFQKALGDTEHTVVINNNVLEITFSSKGGQPKEVKLKKFNAPDSTAVKLASSDFDKIDYSVNTGANSSGYISEFNFHLDTVIENADKSWVVVYALRPDSNGPTIRHQFIIRPDDYMIDFTIQMEGADKLLTQGNLNLTWQYKAIQQESDISFEKQNTQVGYIMDGDFDYHTIGRRSSKDFDKPVKWIGIRQRFFNTFLVAKNSFSSGRMEWIIPPDTARTVMQSIANMRMQLAVDRSASIPFNILYGPADFKMLKHHDMNFEKLINLGQGAYAFVRPLNRFIVIPVFDFIKSFTASMGLAIALLTIFIRTITSPLMYPGYKTSAQMKVLRPDLAKLKEKFPEQQQYAMEQMKFTREAGVNQFAGCLPALVQIPIFFSLYSFFNSNVSFRGQSFLWAKDLSAFDDVIKFGVNIPLLGSHLSLFTITAVITSFLISLYSMSTAMSPDQSNPVMKYMPYIFPFFLLFIFNRLPSALTWYYTVSNVITLILQFIIQNYIIDHDKILAKIEANRKKPKTKSKWQERMEQMQEQQKKMKELQQKNRR
ncbi:MAG TPA: membrane protein insertase YidC [Chitinophagaceae bacterium]|jgi:YidC/Oxa1 family membrane protein insertase|nr:membrane protein insertase YidC [Chitinophagaceae bacterium]